MLVAAIVTYNRSRNLDRIIRAMRKLRSGEIQIVVSDDNSSDDTIDLCHRRRVPVLTGENKGPAGNKNRALSWFYYRSEAQRLILVEDDMKICDEGWDLQWSEAIDRFQHINWCAQNIVERKKERYVAGDGSLESPYLLRFVTGQCMGFSRRAIEEVGFIDPHFRGYGYAHIEYSKRMARRGFGVQHHDVGGRTEKLFAHIRGGMELTGLRTVSDRTSTEANRAVYDSLDGAEIFRLPWRNAEEKAQIEREMRPLRRPRPPAPPAVQVPPAAPVPVAEDAAEQPAVLATIARPAEPTST